MIFTMLSPEFLMKSFYNNGQILEQFYRFLRISKICIARIEPREADKTQDYIVGVKNWDEN